MKRLVITDGFEESMSWIGHTSGRGAGLGVTGLARAEGMVVGQWMRAGMA